MFEQYIFDGLRQCMTALLGIGCACTGEVGLTGFQTPQSATKRHFLSCLYFASSLLLHHFFFSFHRP
jgi:hypothetical protein